MDFSPSATSRIWMQKTEIFFDRYVLPHNAAWHQCVADGVYPPPFLADLKFGAMGLSPDTPLAYFWSWGRAMHLMDGPDEVHLRSIARHALRQSVAQGAALAAYFTTPEQLRAPPQIR
jgi:hypothetical protein